MERLDKILSSVGVCSRSDCAKLARRGLITVNGEAVKRSDVKVDGSAVVVVDGNRIELPRRVVCMMNKPMGLVTSTEDACSRTVMEMLPMAMLHQNVVPVGRLDKDTEGLLLFTNDGNLLHRLISPKRDVPKLYHVEHENDMTAGMIERARKGVVLKDGSVCRPAEIVRLSEGVSTIRITEGMYHQVKRMYGALGCHVNHLKRLSIGDLELGDLGSGQTRELTDDELKDLESIL